MERLVQQADEQPLPPRHNRLVANLTRRDGEEVLALAPQAPVRTEVRIYPLAAANDALTALRDSKVRGAAVLVMDM